MSDTVIILHSTVSQSIKRDIVTHGTLLAMIGVGYVLESSALQWIAAIVWFIAILGRSFSSYNTKRMTPQQAADMLREKFDVVASANTSTDRALKGEGG